MLNLRWFDSYIVLGTLFSCAIDIELCSIKYLSNTVYKPCGPAWLTLLQPSRYLLCIEANYNPKQGFQGIGFPVALGSNNLAIIELLCEYADVFAN